MSNTITTSPPSTLLETAYAFIDGYNTWSIDAIMALRAPNCIQQVYPKRLGRPSNNNDEYRAYFSSLMPIFKDFYLEILDTIEDQARNKVTLHMYSTATTDIGPYGNEYTVMLTMTDDGQQIVEVKEFVDSGYSEEFFPRLREHLASVAQKQ